MQAQASELLYFVMVDRFANGEPANDGVIDLGDPAAWHGGDLQGVTQHLDELQALGVTAVWLSPVFASRQDKFHEYGAFHGYWPIDLHAIEPRFGGEPALRALREALRARGMHLYMDVVVNHVAFGAPLVTQHPDWFHHEGTIVDWNDAAEVERREVHHLPDLAQENPEVSAYLDGVADWLLGTFSPDGFRLDAVKHVPLAFWQRYNARLPHDLVKLGETFDGRPEVLSRTLSEGGFTHLFDFSTAFALRDVACGGHKPGRLAEVIFADREYGAPNRLVTFVDNHDMGRIASACGGDARKVRLALSLLFALRGTPSLLYGTEAGLTGDAEPQNRGDMRFGADADRAALVAELGRQRQKHPALVRGTTRVLGFDDTSLVLLRQDNREALVVRANTGATARPIALPAELAGCAADTTVAAYDVVTTSVAPSCLSALPRGERRVRFDAPRPAAGELLLAGSGPELGRWDAALAPAFPPSGPLELSLPVGGVFVYKLAFRTAAGVSFAPGDNHFLFVPAGADALDVHAGGA